MNPLIHSPRTATRTAAGYRSRSPRLGQIGGCEVATSDEVKLRSRDSVAEQTSSETLGDPMGYANRGPRVTTDWRDMNEAESASVLEECHARVPRALVGVSGSRETAEDGLQDALAAALKAGRPRPGTSRGVRHVPKSDWTARSPVDIDRASDGPCPARPEGLGRRG